MFSMNKFVMRTIRQMMKYESEYKVRRYALTWYEKEVLTDEDMLEIESFYAPMIDESDKTEPVEETV